MTLSSPSRTDSLQAKDLPNDRDRVRRGSIGATAKDMLSPSKISGLYVWGAIILVFSLWLPSEFPTITTWRTILASEAIAGMMAVGLLFVLAAGTFDLSIGYALGTLSIILAVFLRDGMNPVTAIAIVLVFGVVIGAVNGFVVVVLGVDSFIATLGTSSILQAVGLWVSGDQQITGVPLSVTRLDLWQPFGIPVAVIYLVVLAVIAHLALEHTAFGRRLYAIGSGREAARLAGVRTKGYIFVALLITGFVVAIAAVLLTAQVSTATPDVGPEFLLPAFAAAFLGATQIHPGRVNVPGTLIATYLLATGVTGLELAGAQTWVPYAFNGLALILAVALSVNQSRFAARRAVRKRKAELVREAVAD